MPNIHFLGFSREEYEEFKPKVDASLKQIMLGNEAVTSFHPSVIIESCDGTRTNMPYLHIFSSDEAHIDKIKAVIIANQLFFDIESSTGDFIEADKIMKK